MGKLEPLRIRLGEELNEALSRFCARKKITKQDTIAGVLGWFLDQDTLLQSLIAGQIEQADRREVLALVIRRLAADQGLSPGDFGAGRDVPIREVEHTGERPPRRRP